MTNDTYVAVSYFLVLTIVATVAQACHVVLRASFTRLTGRLARRGFAEFLRSCFRLGLLLPALAGMLSVSFVGCSRHTYLEIVANRAYLVQKNQEQLMMSLYCLLAALGVWAAICIALLALGRRSAAKRR